MVAFSAFLVMCLSHDFLFQLKIYIGNDGDNLAIIEIIFCAINKSTLCDELEYIELTK